jgi:hypothetical protein
MIAQVILFNSQKKYVAKLIQRLNTLDEMGESKK